jgi:hypothetical protein
MSNKGRRGFVLRRKVNVINDGVELGVAMTSRQLDIQLADLYVRFLSVTALSLHPH